MKTTIRLDIPKDSRGIEAGAKITPLPGGDYFCLVSITKYAEKKPCRTEIVSEFNSRSVLFAYLKTRVILRRSFKLAS